MGEVEDDADEIEFEEDDEIPSKRPRTELVVDNLMQTTLYNVQLSVSFSWRMKMVVFCHPIVFT
jgi:hypothetical protein